MFLECIEHYKITFIIGKYRNLRESDWSNNVNYDLSIALKLKLQLELQIQLEYVLQ